MPLDDIVKCNDTRHDKPTLRIGRHEMTYVGQSFAERPLQLKRSGARLYYWTMVKDGEHHWWWMIKSTDSAKTG